MDRLSFSVARWLVGEESAIKSMKSIDSGMIIHDIKDRPVLLLSNEWAIRWVSERNPNVEFLEVPEHSQSL